jgi:hypothetical protein
MGFRLWTDIRIPSVGIPWDPSAGFGRSLLVGFDRPLPLISSSNKVVLGANLRDRSKPTNRFCRIPTGMQSDPLSDSLTWELVGLN